MVLTTIASLILKVAVIAMGIASMMLSYFPQETKSETHVPLLSIGLAALDIAALM